MRIVDVSNNNGTVDWPTIRRAGVRGAWCKVTEGQHFVDSYYDANNVSARKQKLRVGGYHFAHPTGDPVVQADLFLQHLRLRRGDMLPVLDIEVADGKSALQIQAWSRVWLRRVHERIGAKPIIYTGVYFGQGNLGSLMREYPVWVASYGQPPPKTMPHVAWQFTDRGVCGLDESTAPNPNALIYKPRLERVIAKKLVKPLVPALSWIARRRIAV